MILGKKFQIEILNITSQLQLEMAISCGSLELNADKRKGCAWLTE